MIEYVSHLTGRFTGLHAEIEFDPSNPFEWLDAAFSYSNTESDISPSMSAGDLVYTPDGKAWICKSEGWASMAPSDQYLWLLFAYSGERHRFALTGKWG